MSKIVYYHQFPPSFSSRLIQFFMGLFGIKRKMEKKIASNTFGKKPASIPKSVFKKFSVEVEKHNDRKTWAIAPQNTASNTLILFLHGGAYYTNINRMHWRLIEKIINRTNASFIVPDYPLAPEFTCEDTYRFLDTVYANLISNYPSKRIVFMGDSAGGGLALGFAQKIRNEGFKQPSEIFLFSPWLDISLTNPDITRFDKHDKILSVNGLKNAGKHYADNIGIKDYRVSPIYGDFSDLGRISIFIGTRDVLIADVRKLKQLLNDQGIGFNYFEYPGMFHNWVLVSNLKETNDVLNKVAETILNDNTIAN